MFQYTCLNPIAAVGLDNLTEDYKKVEDVAQAEAILVRSASMHDMELSENSVQLQEQVPVPTIFLWMNVQRRELLYLIRREPMQTV